MACQRSMRGVDKRALVCVVVRAFRALLLVARALRIFFPVAGIAWSSLFRAPNSIIVGVALLVRQLKDELAAWT